MTDLPTERKTDLAVLMSTDPNNLTRDDISEIITGYRKARHVFNMTGQRPSTKAVKAPSKAISDILGSLDDIKL